MSHLAIQICWWSLCIPNSISLGISLKTAQIIRFWGNPCNKYYTSKRPPKIIYPIALGTYWNEYSMPLLIQGKLPH